MSLRQRHVTLWGCHLEGHSSRMSEGAKPTEITIFHGACVTIGSWAALERSSRANDARSVSSIVCAPKTDGTTSSALDLTFAVWLPSRIRSVPNSRKAFLKFRQTPANFLNILYNFSLKFRWFACDEAFRQIQRTLGKAWQPLPKLVPSPHSKQKGGLPSSE